MGKPSEHDDTELTWTEDDKRKRVEMLADWTRIKVELDAGAKRVHVSRPLAERIALPRLVVCRSFRVRFRR